MAEVVEEIFPEPIRNLPEADIPLEGIKAYLSQSDAHQILFMQFMEDVDLPEHAHGAQAGFVLEGRIDLVIEGEKRTYTKGDRYFIPAGAKHSAKVYRGYADITFFAEQARHAVKK
ncbi:MAG: cupin domain-containing protein [Nitrospiraceae bacterium]|nr:cupin domain-containing protein [Nitrospiraceae bacterium]